MLIAVKKQTEKISQYLDSKFTLYNEQIFIGLMIFFHWLLYSILSLFAISFVWYVVEYLFLGYLNENSRDTWIALGTSAIIGAAITFLKRNKFFL